MKKVSFNLLLTILCASKVWAQGIEDTRIIGTWVAVHTELSGIPGNAGSFQQLQLLPNKTYVLTDKSTSSDKVYKGAYNFAGEILICYKDYDRRKKVENNDSGYYSRERVRFLSKSRMQCSSLDGLMTITYAKIN